MKSKVKTKSMVVQQQYSQEEIIPLRDRTIPLQVETQTNLQIEQLLSDITNRLVNEFRPENIFLFGSHVWGNPHKDSDLDLLVIITDSNLSSSKRSSIAYRCLRNIPYPLDILVKTRKEIEKFAQIPISLEYQILHRGRCLYG
jgi:predicted nucleotidyltransferase